MPDQPLYERDLLAWALDQAAHLRRVGSDRPNLPLDFEHLAEEIETMGRSQIAALYSDLRRVLEHLAKLELSPAQPPRLGWRASVLEHRARCRGQLEISPSLVHRLDAEAVDKAWTVARAAVVAGLAPDGVDPSSVPLACPYSVDQALDEDWWPVNRAGIVDRL